MLEWKTRIFTLLVSFGFVLEGLNDIFRDNWNW